MERAFFTGAAFLLQQSPNLVSHGLEYRHMGDGEGMRRRRKYRQNTVHAIVLANGRDHHGTDSKGTDRGRIDTRVRLGIVTAQLFAGLNAEPGEAAFDA